MHRENAQWNRSTGTKGLLEMLILGFKKIPVFPVISPTNLQKCSWLLKETIWFVGIATQMEPPQVPGEGRCQGCKVLRGNPKLH